MIYQFYMLTSKKNIFIQNLFLIYALHNNYQPSTLKSNLESQVIKYYLKKGVNEMWRLKETVLKLKGLV